MSQARTVADLYAITTTGNDTGRVCVLQNVGGVTLLLSQFNITFNGDVVQTDAIKWSLTFGFGGGSLSGLITPVALNPASPPSTASGAQTFAGIPPGLKTMLIFAMNGRKGFFWQAKKGKEFASYTVNDSWHFFNNGHTGPLVNCAYSMTYEE